MSTLYYQKLKTSVGTLHAVADEKHLLVLAFDSIWEQIRRHYPDLVAKKTPLISQAESELEEYLEGARKKFEVPFAFHHGTPFQRKVWRALTRIPFGKTWSYQQQAEKIEHPKAMRAVGRTNGLNPICVVIPCHRVIGKSKQLTGYAGGLDVKARLLALEGIDLNSTRF